MRFARWPDFGKLDSRRDAATRKFSLHQSLSLFFRAAVRRGRILDQLGDSGRRDEEPIRERGCKISDARTRAQDRCLHKWP